VTAVAGKDARVYVSGFDLSAYFNDAGFEAVIAMLYTTVFTNAGGAKTYKPGRVDATASAAGLWMGDVAESDVVLAAALGVAGTWLYLPAGDGNGKTAKGFASINSAYKVTTPVAGLVGASAAAQSTSGSDQLLVEHPYATESAGGSGTGINNAAASSAGGVGIVEVLAVTGGGSLVVKIQDSADGITYADLLTFTTATGRTSERKTVAGTVRQYTKCLWTLSAGTASFIAAFGRK
jgi:hypothetical protein